MIWLALSGQKLTQSFPLGSAALPSPFTGLDAKLVLLQHEPRAWYARLDAEIAAQKAFAGAELERAFRGLSIKYVYEGFRPSSLTPLGYSFSVLGTYTPRTDSLGVEIGLQKQSIRGPSSGVMLTYRQTFPPNQTEGSKLLATMLPTFARLVEIAVNGLYENAGVQAPYAALRLLPVLTQKQIKAIRAQP